MNLAEQYAALRPAGEDRSVRDELAPAGTVPEIELQARWFSGEFGREFRSVDGRALRVIQFGIWNREAGPDFAEAAISIDEGEPLRGAIELDMDARDWERHGHATNPAYESVVLHVFFQSGSVAAFSRAPSNRAVPQLRLDLSAVAGLPPNPVPLAAPGRCVAPLKDLDLPTVRGVLEGAAQFRVQRKAARLARLREARGEDEALYQALAETLGYKSNKLPFALLSQRVPVRLLRRTGRTGEIDALLFGVAGFLKPDDFPIAAPATKAYLRGLWEKWWALRAQWEGLTVPAKLWKPGGQRPSIIRSGAWPRWRPSSGNGRKFARWPRVAMRAKRTNCWAPCGTNIGSIITPCGRGRRRARWRWSAPAGLPRCWPTCFTPGRSSTIRRSGKITARWARSYPTAGSKWPPPDYSRRTRARWNY